MPAEPTNIAVNPLATFRFLVEIGDKSWAAVFTECKLPDVEWDIQELKEGGRNDYIHQIPGQRKAGKMTLKHGLTKDFWLMDWYSKMMEEDFKDYLQTVTVTLLGPDHKPVLRWNCHNAFPTKITWPELKASDNVVAIQSLDIAVGSFVFEKDPS